MKLTVDDLRKYVGLQVYIKDRQDGCILIGELSKVSLKGTNQHGHSCVLRFHRLVRYSETRQHWVKQSPRQYGLITGQFHASRIAGEIVLTHGRRDSLIIFCSREGAVFDFQLCERTWNPALVDLFAQSESDAV